MLKETLSNMFNIQSRTVNNAIIQLGDTDDSGKGKHFKSRFIQPGVAGYPERDENLLITKDSFDRFIHTLKNKPVIINHKDEITEKDKVGEVHNVWYNPDDGWYWCDGVITDKYAMDLIKSHKWSVSCSYDILKADDKGGSENNIKYGMEILDGIFTHLALVKNPRYERANIVFNSKTVIVNDAEFESKHPRDEQGRFTDGNGASVKLSEQEEKEALYELKQNVLTQLNPKEIGIHKFDDDTARKLYQIGDFTFHGENISKELTQEEYDNLENLGQISQENKLPEEQKISIEKAKEIVSKYIKNEKSSTEQVYAEIIQTEKYKNLPKELKDSVDYIFYGEPVYSITGYEFPNNGEDLNTRVFNFYKQKYNNVINVDNFGEIILDERSIKDSSYHGLSDNKANAFVAVPNVLLKGKHFNTKINYKGKREDRYVFVAPVTIKGENYFCEVVVRNTDKSGNQNGKQRFYLHEVELTKKLANVFTASQGGTSASSKSIIADLISNLNPNVKNNKQTFEEAFTDVFFEALAEVLLETYK